MPKRIVLSGYYGFKNFGDEAILSVLVNKLQELKHRITVISSNPDYTKSQYKPTPRCNQYKKLNILPFYNISRIIFQKRCNYFCTGNRSNKQSYRTNINKTNFKKVQICNRKRFKKLGITKKLGDKSRFSL